VSVSVEPHEPYIETRGSEQRLNFDLLLRNNTTEPLRINKIQVSVYDAQGALAFRRYLDENGRPSGISTLPDRIVPAGGSLPVFNPFFSFDSEMPLVRLHYEIFFEKVSEEEPNLLNFSAKADVDVSPKAYPGKTRLTLPLRGPIYVFDGHDFYAHHRRQNVLRGGKYRPNAVRYGYDLMVTDKAGGLYHGDRFVKENWFSYAAPVYATAAGTVVDAANNVPENSYKDSAVTTPPSADQLDPHGLGNFVTIDHGNGEFSMFNHMKPGSVRVKKGDRVEAGQQIGEIGFSGDTFLPHLHYMLIDGSDLNKSQGVPSYFDDFKRILGTKTLTVKHGQIDSGDIVESLASR
jgi:murein DD-endopeptidase MepM/ murein hydrolase activator NlpD